MSYTPTEWATGDTITAVKLNKLEGGVAAGNVFVVTVTDGETTSEADATFAEIIAAIEAGQTCMARYTNDDGRTIILQLTSYKAGSGGSVTFGHTFYGGSMDSSGLYANDFYVEINDTDYVRALPGKLRSLEIG